MNHTSTKRLRSTASGFTLLEIVIVMTILAVLGASAIYLLKGNVDVAKIRTAEGDIKTISTQLTVYEGNAGELPTTEQGLKVLWEKPAAGTDSGPWVQLMKNEPKDPWKRPYHYARPGTKSGDDFDLWSAGKDGVDGTEDDIGNWKGAAKK